MEEKVNLINNIFGREIKIILLFCNIIILVYHMNNKIEYKPNISIFMPIYNKYSYLKRSIRSIQRQTYKNFEIVAVNDGSEDNSYDLLLKLSNKDSRIKIVNNNGNYGLLYSRAMGIINSRGKYLMNLDPDDILYGKNSLEDLYKVAEEKNADIVAFYLFHFPEKKKSIQLSEYNKIIFQPRIFQSAFNDSELIDYHITNKFIKRTLLIKIYEIFKEKIYGKKWNYHEDNIWSILLHLYAKSLIFIDKTPYYHYRNSYSLSKNINKNFQLEITNIIYRVEMYEKIFDKNSSYIISSYESLINRINKNNINLIFSNNEIKGKIVQYIKKYKEYIIKNKNYQNSTNFIHIFELLKYINESNL